MVTTARHTRILLALTSSAVLVSPAGWTAVSDRDDVVPTPEQRLELAGVKVTIPAMAEALNDVRQDEEVRYLSAIALGRTRDPAVVPILLDALDDKDSVVRDAVLLGLVDVPDPRSIPYLDAFLNDSTQPSHLHELAIYALCPIASPEAVDVLVHVALSDSTADQTRLIATQTLGECKVSGVTDQLRPLLMSDDSDLRITTAITMAQLGDAAGVPILMAALEDATLLEQVGSVAGQALEHATGMDFGFKVPGGGTAVGDDLAAAASRAIAWWDKTKTTHR